MKKKDKAQIAKRKRDRKRAKKGGKEITLSDNLTAIVTFSG